MNSEKTFEIRNCLFDNCHSSKNGGAIYIDRSADSGSIRIINTGFYNCKSKGDSGAFYVNAPYYFELSSCCFTKCSGKLNVIGYGSGKGNRCVINNCYFTDTTNSGSGSDVVLGYNDIYFSKCNISNIASSDCKSVFEFNDYCSISFGESYMFKLVAITFFCFSGTINFKIQNVNFIENKGSTCLADVAKKVTSFYQCSFINDKSKMFFLEPCLLEECVFSDDFSKDKFPSDFATIHCSFKETKSFSINIEHSDGCWALITKSPININKKGSFFNFSTIFTTIILIPVILALAYFIYRHVKGMRNQDSLLRLYSNV